MTEPLKTSIQYLKGVGPKIATLLNKKNIFTVEDLLFFLPRAYEDKRNPIKISDLIQNEYAYTSGEVTSFNVNSYRRLLTIQVSDGTGTVLCKWFRFKEAYFRKFSEGTRVVLSGQVKGYKGNTELHHPDIAILDDNEMSKGLFPIYSEVKGLSQKILRKIMHNAVDGFTQYLEEFIPEDILKKYSLVGLKQSIESIHFPPSNVDALLLEEAKTPWHKRLIFGEFLKLEILLMYRRQYIKKKTGIKHIISDKQIAIINSKIPFELTNDQKIVIKEILEDMKSGFIMNRLIQGDVGTGKTIIAFYATIVSIFNGYQSVMMAPTEILAKQHFENFLKIFPNTIKTELISGSMTKKQKIEIKERLKNGEIDFLIGTHAVIQKDVIFKNLGFVIVDEQHRFGVKQRLQLLNHGNPDVLVLTATPIPRSLAMTVYGDLDVSILREKPKGRQAVTTRLTTSEKRNIVYGFIKDKLKLGYQVYFVYPLIEETEDSVANQIKAAKQALSDISFEFSDYSVALLHGKMRQEEKDLVMKEFKEGVTRILLATTVIEVGIDIANANIMLIENPERFGLSQLHQLRGRIGRGTDKAYCILMLDKFVTRETYERLKIFESTDDGFKIAEADLAIRGPGEFLGTRQHGLPGFRFANIIRDMDILIQAKKEAEFLFSDIKELEKPMYYKLRKYVLESGEADFIKAV